MEEQFKMLKKELLIDGLKASLELEKIKYQAFMDFIEAENGLDLNSVNLKLMMVMQVAIIAQLELMIEKTDILSRLKS